MWKTEGSPFMFCFIERFSPYRRLSVHLYRMDTTDKSKMFDKTSILCVRRCDFLMFIQNDTIYTMKLVMKKNRNAQKKKTTKMHFVSEDLGHLPLCCVVCREEAWACRLLKTSFNVYNWWRAAESRARTWHSTHFFCGATPKLPGHVDTSAVRSCTWWCGTAPKLMLPAVWCVVCATTLLSNPWLVPQE